MDARLPLLQLKHHDVGATGENLTNHRRERSWTGGEENVRMEVYIRHSLRMRRRRRGETQC